MDSTQWKRDPESGSLINVNSDLINKAKEAKALRRAKRQEFEDLKNEVGEIKDLLHKLIEKL
jgi:hypothetical protein|tara:strand:- start:890 stop:1075 length:186 start_codon:yes stop_codon:yes gene_type:complete